jgi:hypothetical protein
MVSFSVMPAWAYDWGGIIVHVTSISPVGYPGNVEFTVDNAPSSCPGSYLFYFPNGASDVAKETNAKAILTIVLSAQLTGRSLTVYGINPSSSFPYCSVQWIVQN